MKQSKKKTKPNINKIIENWSSKTKQKVYLKGMASAMKIKMGHTKYQKCSWKFLPMFF